jgi:hypothetical protein
MVKPLLRKRYAMNCKSPLRNQVTKMILVLTTNKADFRTVLEQGMSQRHAAHDVPLPNQC